MEDAFYEMTQPLSDRESYVISRLEQALRPAKNYYDAGLLQLIKTHIPIDDLNIKATLRFSSYTDRTSELDLRDCLLVELLYWFKESFFSWANEPQCIACNESTQHIGHGTPNEAEMKWHASTVELYLCHNCRQTFRFPRYNHPQKLLETRTGRCGEWATCFTVMCWALDYEARLVHDWTDHVWTEVYSTVKHRWVHCDVCENVYDKPLLYETGWKKKLNYVIAVSPFEVQDVTWRYTADFKKVLRRRTLCNEALLLRLIAQYQNRLSSNIGKDKKSELLLRRVQELAEFLTPPRASEELGGRTSGSLDWRLRRGEAAERTVGYVFKPCPEEIAQKYFCVRYCCATDTYFRPSKSNEKCTDWKLWTVQYCDIFRKVEQDWKMVYLARVEGSDGGIIQWAFKFGALVVKKLILTLSSETFENGKVKWEVIPVFQSGVFPIESESLQILTYLTGACALETEDSEDCSEFKVIGGGIQRIETEELKDCSGFRVVAQLLDGGNDANAWQKSQLFRQPLNSQEFSFQVEVEFY